MDQDCRINDILRIDRYVTTAGPSILGVDLEIDNVIVRRVKSIRVTDGDGRRIIADCKRCGEKTDRDLLACSRSQRSGRG